MKQTGKIQFVRTSDPSTVTSRETEIERDEKGEKTELETDSEEQRARPARWRFSR